MAQSCRDFVGCEGSYHTVKCGTVWKKIYMVFGEILHRVLCYSLGERLKDAWRVITWYNMAHSGRVFIGCVERYHTANCGTVWQRVYRMCRELLNHTI